nr:hypothetical protein [Tanacetum cinerariifolium]
QDNSPKINRNAGYENQRNGNVAGARENVDAADSEPILDDEPLQKVSNDDHYNVFALESVHPEQSKLVHDTYPIKQDAQNVIIDSLNMSYDREEIDQNDDDNDLAKECELLASLIEKLECEIDESKNRTNFWKHQTSFAKPEFLKKAQRANPHLYDIGCYNDNLALMLAPDSDEVIRLEKESLSKLSDLIRPFDYDKLNNLYHLFVPQREKSFEQRYFSERSRLSHWKRILKKRAKTKQKTTKPNTKWKRSKKTKSIEAEKSKSTPKKSKSTPTKPKQKNEENITRRT